MFLQQKNSFKIITKITDMTIIFLRLLIFVDDILRQHVVSCIFFFLENFADSKYKPNCIYKCLIHSNGKLVRLSNFHEGVRMRFHNEQGLLELWETIAEIGPICILYV